MNFNKVIIYGNMTRDPELKALPTSGNSVCNFSVATNRTWTGKDGQKQTDVQFHNVVCYGRQAETVAQYMRKGSGILVEGRLQTRQWQTKDGQKRQTTEIVAESVQFGPRPRQGSPAKAEEEEQLSPSGEGVDEGVDNSDLPF